MSKLEIIIMIIIVVGFGLAIGFGLTREEPLRRICTEAGQCYEGRHISTGWSGCTNFKDINNDLIKVCGDYTIK
jgi:hypothetical protein